MPFRDDGSIRFYRVLTARIPEVGRCTTQVEIVGELLVLRPDTTTWFEVPLDHAAACRLLDALTGEVPGVIRVQHPQNGATTVTVALHGPGASLRVENASRGGAARRLRRDAAARVNHASSHASRRRSQMAPPVTVLDFADQ